MISNNFKAFFIHIFVNAVSLVLYYMLTISVGVAEWVSESAYKAHVNKMIILALGIVIIAFALYYISGKRFLKDQGSMLKNLLSVSSVTVIGLIWWLMILPLSQLDAFSKSNLWHTFAIYESYILSLIGYLEADIPVLLMLSTMPPVLLMTLGIKKQKGENII